MASAPSGGSPRIRATLALSARAQRPRAFRCRAVQVRAKATRRGSGSMAAVGSAAAR